MCGCRLYWANGLKSASGFTDQDSRIRLPPALQSVEWRCCVGVIRTRLLLNAYSWCLISSVLSYYGQNAGKSQHKLWPWHEKIAVERGAGHHDGLRADTIAQVHPGLGRYYLIQATITFVKHESFARFELPMLQSTLMLMLLLHSNY